jgi:hypothetical protein
MFCIKLYMSFRTTHVAYMLQHQHSYGLFTVCVDCSVTPHYCTAGEQNFPACLSSNGESDVGYEVLTAVSMKIAVFWVVVPCSLVEVYRPVDGGSKDLWNVGKLLPDYTVLQPRRQQSPGNLMFQKYVLMLLCSRICGIFPKWSLVL